MPHDFCTRYCQHTGADRKDFATHLLARTLYPQARVLRPLLQLFDSDYFAADRDFISGIGRISRRDEFSIEANEFAHHPSNRGFARSVLRLRVSTRRMQREVARVFDGSHRTADRPPGSGGPFTGAT
jgi:hypothetical protein